MEFSLSSEELAKASGVQCTSAQRRKKKIYIEETKRISANLPHPAICRICEPIAFMSIFPYVYFMVEDFFRNDPNQKQGGVEIAVYAGMVTSAFAFAEFSSGVPWGRLSDKIGRKPVLLTGLAGTALSMLIFGFAPNLPVALLARALGGLLNGYVSLVFPGEFSSPA